jgi:hypothetical protein
VRDAITMEPNLFTQFERALEADGGQRHWTIQAPFDPHADFDLMLVPHVADWSEHDGAIRSLERIEAERWASAMVPTATGVGVRLHDEWFELSASRSSASSVCSPQDRDERTASTLDGERVAVYFWGANMTKALHVGHLRDLAIGNALCAALTAAGAQVERRSLIADVGRGMGEAIAGVVHSGRHLQEQGDLPEKSDHFVGACYADYVQSAASTHALDAHTSDSLDREVIMHDDGADAILERLLAGDPATTALWSKVREWVLSGHQETLARLGIAFDDVIFESAFMADMDELSRVGFRAGLLSYREDGAVVYLTGREELEEMPLVRPDGLPTQHMRALAYWATAPELDGMTSIQVCGSEWVSHVTCRCKLIDELARDSPSVQRLHPTHTLFHGMVTEGGERLASSQGALRLDELIEWIDAEIERDPRLRAERDALESQEGFAARIALGYFLLHPTGKSIELDLPSFFAERQSLGWDLARARARAWSGEAVAEHALAQPECRFLLLRSELLEHQLELVAERLDVTPIARLASHVSQWWLAEERPAGAVAAMRALLDRLDRCLGLELT